MTSSLNDYDVIGHSEPWRPVSLLESINLSTLNMVFPKKTRPGQFPKGYTPWNDNQCISSVQQEYLQSSQAAVQQEHTQKLQSSPRASTDENQRQSSVQSSEGVTYNDNYIYKYNRSSADETPYIRGSILTSSVLRPSKPVPNYKLENQSENVIVSLDILPDLITSCSGHFPCKHRLSSAVESRKGLCVRLCMFCDVCKFRGDPVQMTPDIKTPGKRGPPANELNERMSIACLKTKAGPSDINFFLASLNIRPPGKNLAYRKLNKHSDVMVEMNRASMMDNQKIAKQQSGSQDVDLETDTAYNNRLQSGYEAGTQAFAPAIDRTTGLVLNCETANKLCRRKQCSHSKCYQTHAQSASIASCEAKLAERNLTSLKKTNIVSVSSLTTDDSKSIKKMLRDKPQLKGSIKHYDCIVHKLRNLQKAIKKARIKPIIRRGIVKSTYQQQIAACIRRRAYYEFIKLKRIGARSEVDYKSKMSAAVANIIPCLCNIHRGCQTNSMVCQAHTAHYTTKFLPCGKHLNLSASDQSKLTKILTEKLNPSQIEKIEKGFNTNRSESMHHRVFTYAPKCTTYARNFNGLCHSAVHSHTYGTGCSTMLLGKTIGLSNNHGPMVDHMRKMDIRAKWDYHRQTTKPVKYKRYIAKRSRCNRHQI
jgi:hypothetical protein